MTSIQTSNDPPSQFAFDEDIFCPQCGYNLRGVESDRCPECGREFDRATLRVSAIPWVHRHEIGRFRAYWRTVWFVTARTKRFAEELWRPVAFGDAQRFRWLTVLNLCLSIPLIVAVPIVLEFFPSLKDPIVEEIVAMIWTIVAVGVALVLALVAITGLPSYAFHPQGLPIEMQNRAIALSYYACAPLAWTLVMALLLGVYLLSLELSGPFERASDSGLLIVMLALLIGVPGVLGLVLEPFFWWFALWRLARRVFQHSYPGRLLWIAGLPILWPVVVVLIVGGISLVVGYVALVVDSLR